MQPQPYLGFVSPSLNFWRSFIRPPDRDRDAPLSTEPSQLYHENRRLRRRLADQERVQRDVLHNLHNSQQRASVLSHHLNVQSSQLQHTRTTLAQADADHATTRRLLVERTAELDGAQAFLNQADNVSGADVIAMVDALNAEILQNAAFMADSLEDSLPSLNPRNPYPYNRRPSLSGDGESVSRVMRRTSVVPSRLGQMLLRHRQLVDTPQQGARRALPHHVLQHSKNGYILSFTSPICISKQTLHFNRKPLGRRSMARHHPLAPQRTQRHSRPHPLPHVRRARPYSRRRFFLLPTTSQKISRQIPRAALRPCTSRLSPERRRWGRNHFDGDPSLPHAVWPRF